MSDHSASAPLVVLAKLTAARFSQDWHYHLANAAGRPRCGTALNLRAWQRREMSQAPAGLCARCTRLLHPRAASSQRPLRVADAECADIPEAEQLVLPLA